MEDNDMPMVLHTQYHTQKREGEEWVTTSTLDSKEWALMDLEWLAKYFGRRNVRIQAITQYCEPADFLA